MERYSDAGEPTGTAGIPILQVLRGAGVSDVLVVVIRWFGGTKLGKGGLARAYAGVTKEALAGVKLAEKTQVVSIEAAFSYEQLGAVKRLVHPPQIEIESEDYGEEVGMRLQVETRRLATLLGALADLGVRVDRSSETGVD